MMTPTNIFFVIVILLTFLTCFDQCTSLAAPNTSYLNIFSAKRLLNFSYPDSNFSHSFGCSRLASRRARHFLDDHFWWHVDRHNFILPESCPFSDSRDIFSTHETMKLRLRHSQWKCNICNKEFVSEYYVDLHMDSKHHTHMPIYNSTSITAATSSKNNITFVCLADYCEILRCSDAYDEIDHTPKEGATCRPAKMKSLRNQCNNIMNQCFPYDDDDTNNELKTYFAQHLCASLKCEIDDSISNSNSDSSDFDNNVVHATLNPSEKSKYMYKVSVWLALFVLTLFVVAAMFIIQITTKDRKYDDKEAIYRHRHRSPKRKKKPSARTQYGNKNHIRGTAAHALRRAQKVVMPSTTVKID